MGINLKTHAEDLEKQARLAKREKNYDEAIALYQEAQEVYEELGFAGNTGMIKKEIDRITTLKSFLGGPAKSSVSNSPEIDSKRALDKEASDLESKLKTLIFQEKFDEVIAGYERLSEIYETMGYDFQLRKVRFEIEKYKTIQIQKQSASLENQRQYEEHTQSIAEERAERIRHQKQVLAEQEEYRMQKMEEERASREAMKFERQRSAQEKIEAAKNERLMVFEAKKEGKDLTSVQAERSERERKLREIEQKKREEDAALNEATQLLDLAKNLVDKKAFDDAAQYYQQAADKFQSIGWASQATVLKTEVNNMARMKAEYLEKLQKEEDQRRKQQELFDARAAKILAEKEAKRKAIEAERNKLPPEIQAKWERAEMLHEKAKNLVEKGKTEKAIARLEYLLDLYAELGADAMYTDPIKEEIAALKPS